ASFHPLWAHIMILIAYHPQKGCGFANTQIQDHSIYWLSTRQFRHYWRNALNCLIEINYSEA
ncbi:MAG: hypothetical protein ACPL7A_02380, partial [Anaerolineales bacterium]